MNKLSKTLLFAGAAVAHAQESELFGNKDFGNGGDGLQCDAMHLRKALKKANYMAEDFSLCHRDLTKEFADPQDRFEDGDQCDKMIYGPDDAADTGAGFLACPVSVYMRAKPMTFVNNNPEVVLCCWQLGYTPDWILLPSLSIDFQAAEASDPFEPLDDATEIEDGEATDEATDGRRELQAGAPSASDVGKRAWPKWEPLKSKSEWDAFKAKLLEMEKEHVYETMAKMVPPAPAISAHTLKGKFPRKLEHSLDEDDTDQAQSEYGGDYDCNNYWGLRHDMLMAFDDAPIGAGMMNDRHSQPGFRDAPYTEKPRGSVYGERFVKPNMRRLSEQPSRPPSAPPSAPPAPPRYHNEVRLPGSATCQEGNCRATAVFWPTDMYQKVDSSTGSFTSSYSWDFDTRMRYVGLDKFRSLCVDGILNRYDASWVMAVLARQGALQCCLDQPGLAMDDRDFDLEEFITRNYYVIGGRFHNHFTEPWCAPNCPPSWPGDGVCDDGYAECYNTECNWDNGDCA